MALPMPDPASYQRGRGGRSPNLGAHQAATPYDQYPANQPPWPQPTSGPSSGKKKRPIIKGIARRKAENNPLKWGLSIDQEWFDANEGHRAFEGATELPQTNKQIKQIKAKEKAVRIIENNGIDPEEKKCSVM
ncbi:hypothetical protein BGZ60DRAFT_433682 [Tricladium varicosporioides]|nr:hypothetical protein BGZ60DRAFT_433682 [Hymenoscyphus varicosporioides]